MSKKKVERLTWHQRIFAIIVAAAVISYWRGIWGLLDLYLYPSNEAYSYLLSIVLGLILILATYRTHKLA